MEIQGRVKLIGEAQTFGANGFRKREIVITTDEQYPQHIMVEFVQDRCELLNNFQVGQDVKISINLRGREWLNPQGETKYFNSIQGWRIENLQNAANTGGNPLGNPTSAAATPVAPNTQTTPSQTTSFEPAVDLKQDDHDDLPF